MTDTDGFPLESISEKSDGDYASSIKAPKRGGKRALYEATSYGTMQNGDDGKPNETSIVSSSARSRPVAPLATRTSVPPDSSSLSARPSQTDSVTSSQYHNGQTLTPLSSSESATIAAANAAAAAAADRTRNFARIELTEVSDADDDNEREGMRGGTYPPTTIQTDDAMLSSTYTSGTGDNDELEIHQLSAGDIDAYLDIYFETLNNRVTHFIGRNERLQQFRTEMKNRLNSNPNAREYQSVLLGKIGGEVLAAVTMSFPNDPPTIPVTPNAIDSGQQAQNSCFSSLQRWFVRKANYIPTNTHECYIEMIGVKDPYRRQGIGTAMLECVEHFAHQAGAQQLTIHINGQELQTYFERFSFVLDNSDYSSLWKWLVERESIVKMTKQIVPQENEQDFLANTTSGGYTNDSMRSSVQSNRI